MGFVSTPAGTTIQVGSNGSPLSGAVILQPGTGVTLSQAGQTIIARGETPSRALDLWVPGVLTAETLLLLAGLKDPYVTQIDAYFQTAPVGPDAGNNAALRFSGSTSGLVELPFNPGASEYHSNVAADNLLGSNGEWFNAEAAHNGLANPFKTAGALTVGVIAYVVTDGVVGASAFRIGFADTFGPADGITTATIPWLTDTAGNPAHVDVAAADIVTGFVGATNFVYLNSDVDLAAGTEYCLVVHRLTATDGQGSAGSNALYTGNVIAPTLNSEVGTGCPVGTTAWNVAGAGGHPNLRVALIGTVIGAPLVGTVTAEIVLNGAPTAAQVGADLRASLLL